MKTRNLMAAFAFALCLGLGAYENFDAAYKDAQRLEKENKNPEALVALQKAAALSQADWQRYRVFATAANIHLKTQKPEEAAKQVAALQALALNQEQTIALHLLNARVLTAQKKTADAKTELRKIIAIQNDFEPYYLYAGATVSLNQLNDPALAGEFIRKFNANKRGKAEWMLSRVKDMEKKIEIKK